MDQKDDSWKDYEDKWNKQEDKDDLLDKIRRNTKEDKRHNQMRYINFLDSTKHRDSYEEFNRIAEERFEMENESIDAFYEDVTSGSFNEAIKNLIEKSPFLSEPYEDSSPSPGVFVIGQDNPQIREYLKENKIDSLKKEEYSAMIAWNHKLEDLHGGTQKEMPIKELTTLCNQGRFERLYPNTKRYFDDWELQGFRLN